MSSVFLLLMTSCSSDSPPDVTPGPTSTATATPVATPSPAPDAPATGTPADQLQPTETPITTVEPTIIPEPTATESPIPATPDAGPTVERFRPVEGTAPLLFPDVVPAPVAAFLSEVEENGVVSTDAGRAFSNDSVSAGGCLSAQHWRRQLAVGGQIAVFLYADAEEAQRAAEVVPVYAICDGQSDWAFDVYFFRLESLIVFLTIEDFQVYEVVESIAGPHFACARGFNLGPSVCELPG